MMRGSSMLCALALLLAAPGAGAEEADELEHLTTWNPGGIAFTVGGGLGGFSASALRDRASGIGAAYEVRGWFGSGSHVAIELAHFGVVQKFELEAVDSVRLVALGGEAAVRVNVLKRSQVQPYALGGVGLAHLNLLGAAGEDAGGADRRNIVLFPAGAGVSIYFGDFVFDVRGQYRFATDDEDDLFMDIDDANLSSWSTTAQLGWHVP